jgi:hypothetical protein
MPRSQDQILYDKIYNMLEKEFNDGKIQCTCEVMGFEGDHSDRCRVIQRLGEICLEFGFDEKDFE